jgi:hypothetical protein
LSRRGWLLVPEASSKRFEAIVIDTFRGDSVPQHLCSTEFFQLVRQRLTPSGSVFLNVFVPYGSDLRTDIAIGSMAGAEFTVRVLESPGPSERNAIVMGGAVARLRPPTLVVGPEVLRHEIIAELDSAISKWSEILGFEHRP